MKKLFFTLAAIASFATITAQNTNQATVVETTDGVTIDQATAQHGLDVIIEPVALIDVHGPAGVEVERLEFTIDGGATEAGLYNMDGAVANVVVNHTYVPTTAVAAGAQINVSIDALIPGVSVKLQATDKAQGSFIGTPGSVVAGERLLTVAGIDIRTGVKASYTGDGFINGTALAYSLDVNTVTFGQLTAGTKQATITYAFSAL